MKLALAMIVRDEEPILNRCLLSVRPLIDYWTIIDTGSTDGTAAAVEFALAGIPGQLLQDRWSSFGENRTRLLEAARYTGDWILTLDADHTIWANPELKLWLADQQDVDAWMVELADHGWRYRLPYLVRGGLGWRYSGATHEFLELEGRSRRSLLGLTVTHHCDGARRPEKLADDLRLLEPGLVAGDPRSTFYYAQTLADLGRTDEAVALYLLRAGMTDGYDEERWFASYRAAELAGDLAGLLNAFLHRQWRPEPLQAAARLVAAERGYGDDCLFLQPVS